LFLSLRQKSKIFATSLVRGRLSAAAGLGIAKAFWNHRHRRWFSLYKNEEGPGGPSSGDCITEFIIKRIPLWVFC
ncbi:MAG: hypothetical protein IJB91_06645, partial [Oscillospiraceae bacterium]|nr:hypothetical protein [Oscillospiraceae bacterium]